MRRVSHIGQAQNRQDADDGAHFPDHVHQLGKKSRHYAASTHKHLLLLDFVNVKRGTDSCAPE